MTEEAANEVEEAADVAEEAFDESVPIDLFQRDLKALSEEERQACDEFLMAESVAWKVAKRIYGRQGQAATGFLQRIVDKIWIDAYRKAKERFDPNHGAKFKTLLYKICYNKALNERRRYLVRFPKRYSKVVVTVCMKGNGIHNSYYPEVLRGIRGLRHCKYVFDFSGSRQFFFPLEFKEPFHVEALFSNFDALDLKDHPISSISESAHWLERNELFARVGSIGDDEFQKINKRRLPKLYKSLNKATLRRELARIDVEIVRMYTLVGNPDGSKVTQKQVQETVHITRDFYDYRIEAIVKRLKLKPKRQPSRCPLPSREFDDDPNPKKACSRKVCLLAIRLNSPVLKKIFTFAEDQSDMESHADEQKYVFVWQDTPTKPMRKDERYVPENERWDLVELYVDRFADDR